MHFIDLELADQVCDKLKLARTVFTKMTIEISEERVDEIKEMKRIRQLYSNKWGTDFKFTSFREFYLWYLNQYKKQEV